MEDEEFSTKFDPELGGYPSLKDPDRVKVFGKNRRPYVTTREEAIARVQRRLNAERDKRELENERKDMKLPEEDKAEIDKEISKKDKIIEENKSEEDPELDKARGDLKKINEKLDVIETTDEEYDYLVERKQELEEQLGINSFSNNYQEEDEIFSPKPEDMDDINHWYNDDPREEWNQMEINQGVLDRFSKDYGYDSDDNLQNLKDQIDYMKNPGESLHRTAERLVEGGDFLVYNDDIKTWLDAHGIKYTEDNFFDKYKEVMANSVEKLYNDELSNKERGESLSRASENIRKLDFEFDDRTGDLMFNSKEDLEKAAQYMATSLNEIYGKDYDADFKYRIKYNEQGDNDFIEIYDANESVGSESHIYDDFGRLMQAEFGEEGSDIFTEPYDNIATTMAGFYGRHIDYPPEDEISELPSRVANHGEYEEPIESKARLDNERGKHISQEQIDKNEARYERRKLRELNSKPTNTLEEVQERMEIEENNSLRELTEKEEKRFSQFEDDVKILDDLKIRESNLYDAKEKERKEAGEGKNIPYSNDKNSEYQKRYAKFNEIEDKYRDELHELYDRIDNAEGYKLLLEKGETPILGKDGNLLFNPKYDDKNYSRKTDLGIDVKSDKIEKYSDILSGIQGQMSDGMWENSPGMAKYWANMNFQQDKDRLVLATPSGRWSGSKMASINGWSEKSDEEIRNYLANKIKAITKEDFNIFGGGEWSRDNPQVLNLFHGNDVTVADAYELYDILKGRK